MVLMSLCVWPTSVCVYEDVFRYRPKQPDEHTLTLMYTYTRGHTCTALRLQGVAFQQKQKHEKYQALHAIASLCCLVVADRRGSGGQSRQLHRSMHTRGWYALGIIRQLERLTDISHRSFSRSDHLALHMKRH